MDNVQGMIDRVKELLGFAGGDAETLSLCDKIAEEIEGLTKKLEEKDDAIDNYIAENKRLGEDLTAATLARDEAKAAYDNLLHEVEVTKSTTDGVNAPIIKEIFASLKTIERGVNKMELGQTATNKHLKGVSDTLAVSEATLSDAVTTITSLTDITAVYNDTLKSVTEEINNVDDAVTTLVEDTIPGIVDDVETVQEDVKVIFEETIPEVTEEITESYTEDLSNFKEDVDSKFGDLEGDVKETKGVLGRLAGAFKRV